MLEQSHHRFLSISVTGGIFIDDFRLDLTAGVNCLGGGTGAGKTTILELLTFAVQPESDEVSEHVRATLGTGTLRVTAQMAHGARYLIERTVGSAPRILDEGGRPIAAAIDRLFPVDYFRVHQIEKTGRDAASQLQLIDRFAVDETHEFESMIANVKRALVANAAEQTRLQAAAQDKRDDASAAAVVEEKLKGLATAGQQTSDVAEANVASGIRQQERHAIATALQALGKTREEGGRFAALLSRRFASIVDDALLAAANGEIMSRVAAHVATVRSECEKALTALGDACDTAEATIRDRERSLAARHQEQDATHQALLNQAKEEATRAEERRQLQQKLAVALAARKQLEQVHAERRMVDEKQRELVTRLLDVRDRRFARRKVTTDHLTALLGPTITIAIVQYADKEPLRKLLNEKLKNSKMQYGKIVDKIVDTLTPDELVAYVRRGDAAELAERLAVDIERTQKTIDRLSDCETLCEIEMCELPDVPRIRLLDGTPKDIAAVSTGQRCTAILPIILLATERPLLIDQPEDDIEGAFLCDVIIKSIRAIKARRQLIFATHSPNIVVLSDSERVTILASDGRAMRVVAAGTVDEMKGHIQAVLEGGADAFSERMKRYGY